MKNFITPKWTSNTRLKSYRPGATLTLQGQILRFLCRKMRPVPVAVVPLWLATIRWTPTLLHRTILHTRPTQRSCQCSNIVISKTMSIIGDRIRLALAYWAMVSCPGAARRVPILLLYFLLRLPRSTFPIWTKTATQWWVLPLEDLAVLVV